MKKISIAVAVVLVAFGASTLIFRDLRDTEYVGDGFLFAYDGGIFAQTGVNESQPMTDIRYRGIKLISEEKLSVLGKMECSYGATGGIYECTAEREPGISFTVINDSVEHLTSELNPELKSDVEISGKKSVLWQIGAEGDGEDFHYIPLASDKTLLITRQYVNEGRENGFPSKTLFDEVISTLRIQ